MSFALPDNVRSPWRLAWFAAAYVTIGVGGGVLIANDQPLSNRPTERSTVENSAREQSPSSEDVSRWIDALADDNPRARVIAKERLLNACRRTDTQQRERVRQSLFRAGLCTDLEAQSHIERLINEIDEAGLRQDLEHLIHAESVLADAAEPILAGTLAIHWQTFASRAGDDRDTRMVFANVATTAGPSMRWRAINSATTDRYPHPRRHPSQTHQQTLISHLGCIAPTQPHFHDIESRLVYRRLDQFGWADHTMTATNANVRVLGRLIDRTLLDNPYGWSIEQRLRLALMYQRDSVAVRICDLVLNSAHRLPLDWASTMLTLRQIERREQGSALAAGSDWGGRFAAVATSLGDSRLLAVTPGQVLTPPEPALFDSGRVRTRVQDVAAWVCLDRNSEDARQCGMPQLIADPLWGVQCGTIGFATQYERDQLLTRLRVDAGNDGRLPRQATTER